MSALHLFNPENDLALAAGAERYTPPRAAAEMARCGQLFPMWLAESADSVLVTGTGKADAVLAASLFHFNELPIPELKKYLQSRLSEASRIGLVKLG